MNPSRPGPGPGVLGISCRLWNHSRGRFLVLALTALRGVMAGGQEAPALTLLPRWESGEVRLELVAPAGVTYRVEAADHLPQWIPLVTLRGRETNQVTAFAPPESAGRYYRAVAVSDPAALTGDHLVTGDGEVVFHPVNHASFVFQWKDRMIYNDPVGGASRYSGLAKPDLILISHDHGDHFDASTLNAVRNPGTILIAPAVVYSRLSAALKAWTIPLANGGQTNLLGLTVEAIPAYNSNHPKGAGNGYVVTAGDRRIYIAGDTGNIAEMRALTHIDVAFVCMNVPFTMTIADAINAVGAFRPRVVYPYHFRNQNGSQADLAAFQRGVTAEPGIEVRRRTWY